MERTENGKITGVSEFTSSVWVSLYGSSNAFVLSVTCVNSIKSTWLIIFAVLVVEISLCQITFWIKGRNWSSHRSLCGAHLFLPLGHVVDNIILWSSSSTHYHIYASIFREHGQIVLFVVKHSGRWVLSGCLVSFIFSLLKLDSIRFNDCWYCVVLGFCFLVFFIKLICWTHKLCFLVWLIILIVKKSLELFGKICLCVEKDRPLFHSKRWCWFWSCSLNNLWFCAISVFIKSCFSIRSSNNY